MKDAWFDPKTLVIKTLNPKLKPVPSPPPPGSLPPPSKIPDTKNDVGGGRGERGQEEPLPTTITAILVPIGEN